MFEKTLAVIAYLSILPVRRNASINEASSALYAFPVAGLVIGAISGGIGALVFATGFEPLFAAACTVAAVSILTGMHHLDGLADLADAMMLRGTRERKIAALKDAATGTAGTAAVAIYLITLCAAIYHTGSYAILGAMITAEVMAKVSMVVLLRAGTVHDDSSAAPFARSADTNHMIVTIAVGVIIGTIVSGVGALAAGLAAVAAALLIGRLSISSLGSLRGDALGAANEIARLAALVVLVGVI